MLGDVRRWIGGLVGAALMVGGCGPATLGDPLVLHIRELHGTMEVAEDAEAELRTTDTTNGVKLLTRGALIKLHEGSRIRLTFLEHPAILWLHGPGEFEIGEVRLERSDAGIHGKVEDIHATFHVNSGIIAGANEGPAGERPSIEVVTRYASARMDPFGKWAVVSDPDEKTGGEAWVRDSRGPGEERLLLTDGGNLSFPPNGVLYWTHEQGATEQAVDDADRDFIEAFLDGLTIDLREFEGTGQLLDECSWKRIR